MAFSLLKLSVPKREDKQLSTSQQKILREILVYVVAHPDAKDTVEGIRKWWGLKGRTEPGEDEGIQRALDFLVTRRWVREREVTPAPRIYGVNKARLTEITAFLQELESKAKGDAE